MNEQIAILLYENASLPAASHTGRYTPADSVKGWNYALGDTLWLDSADGGAQQGTIASIDPDTFTDAHGARYRVAYLALED